MHPLSFLLKRGHLSAVAMGRNMFARVPAMTPARFDVLHLIFERSRSRVVPGLPLAQAELRALLGLRRQTVWESVTRLVELGWVEKVRDQGRRILLRLTEEGAKCIRVAYGAAFTERYPLPSEIPLDQPETRIAHRIVRDEARDADELAIQSASMKYSCDRDLARRIAISTAPAKVGREVAKTFTAFAWSRTPGGRRGRRMRHLHELDTMICEARALARDLGDKSELIYELDYEVDH